MKKILTIMVALFIHTSTLGHEERLFDNEPFFLNCKVSSDLRVWSLPVAIFFDRRGATGQWHATTLLELRSGITYNVWQAFGGGSQIRIHKSIPQSGGYISIDSKKGNVDTQPLTYIDSENNVTITCGALNP